VIDPVLRIASNRAIRPGPICSPALAEVEMLTRADDGGATLVPPEAKDNAAEVSTALQIILRIEQVPFQVRGGAGDLKSVAHEPLVRR